MTKVDMTTEVGEAGLGTTPGEASVAKVATEYAQVKRNVAKAKADLKGMERQAKALEQKFIEACGTHGVGAIRVEVDDWLGLTESDGDEDDDTGDVDLQQVRQSYTLTPYEQIVAATTGGQDAVIAALKRSRKYAFLVKETVNKRSLDSQVKEIVNDPDRSFPKSWDGVISSFSQWKVSMVNAKTTAPRAGSAAGKTSKRGK